MRLFICVLALELTLLPVLAAVQVALQRPPQLEWDAPPHPDETGHLIFDAVANLLKHASNTHHLNGHTLIPATITPGTPLYHGRPTSAAPTEEEWLSFDADHSLLFAAVGDTGHLFLYVAARPLKMLYFDGYSAPRYPGGTADTQDVILGNVSDEWAQHRTGGPFKWNRIVELCAWGRNYGVDGFIRMEMDFEVMYCNFSDDGLALTAAVPLLPIDIPFLSPCDDNGHYVPLNSSTSDPPSPPSEPRELPCNVPPPVGWRGSRRDGTIIEVDSWAAGNRHNFIPLPGVTPDYSRLMTFFDVKHTSLVKLKRHQTRTQYRLLNISEDDVETFRAELHEVWSRSSNEMGSGVHWGNLMRYVQEVYADRLDFVRYLLHRALQSSDKAVNMTQTISDVRQQVLTMLAPYMTKDAIPPVERGPVTNSSWLAPTMHRCASLWTASLNVSTFTPQEHILKSSLDTTTKQICRSLGLIWTSAFAAESISASTEQSAVLHSWTQEIDRLMKWLDWTTWLRCEPACLEDEMCTLPQMWQIRENPGEPDMTPFCLSKIRGSPDGLPRRPEK